MGSAVNKIPLIGPLLAPDIPKPPAPPTAAEIPKAPTPVSPAVIGARQNARRRASGLATNSILTGPQGLGNLGLKTTGQKTLLGA